MLLRSGGEKYIAEWLATAWMIVYVLLKYKAVDYGLGSFGVNALSFLILDLATVPSYVWGCGRMVRRLKEKQYDGVTLAWGWVALGSFLLPYSYLLCSGYDEMPRTLFFAVVALVFLLLLATAMQVRRKLSGGNQERSDEI